MKIKQAIENAKIRLSHNNINTQLEAELLLSYILSKPKSYIYGWPEQELSMGQVAMFESLLQRRLNGEPIAYIIGEKEFYSLRFKVTKDSLIPRPETEILVDYILNYLDKNNSNKSINILDLGTGTGAIAIALYKNFTDPVRKINITAVDKNTATLEVAKSNAKLHNVANINFLESNWYSNLDNKIKFDIIVSNPPYIDIHDPYYKNTAIADNIYHEPKEALISAEKGLYDIKKILHDAKDYINSNGILVIEHGHDQLDIIKSYVGSLGFRLKSLQDLSGKNRAVVVSGF